MKKSDIILIVVILIAALGSYLVFRQITNDSALEDGVAYVYYNNERIMGIDLVDGSYEVYIPERVIEINDANKTYHVEGSNSYGVLIEYKDNRVRVIDEESPKHICQAQGWSNSPLAPITCLPNNIIILIESVQEDLPDGITG